MADKVPDTEVFSLQDVIDVVGGNSLQDCFDNAVLAGFDPLYDDNVKGSGVRNSLYNFRNYQLTTGTVIYNGYAYYGPVIAPYSVHTVAWLWGTDFQAVHDLSIGELDPVSKEYFQCTTEVIPGALTSTHINRVHLRFDLTGIPPGATIVSATLKILLYYGQYFGTEYSPANNYGEIYLYESNAWASVSGALYGSIKTELSGQWRQPLFNGATAAYGNYKWIHALSSDFPRLENYFGAHLYGTFVTRQDKDIKSPGYGQKLGLHIDAPSSDSPPSDYFRRLESINMEIEYTP
jgi:hypothetical protein